MKHVTGLILAGGAGRRVDGRDKGLLLWRGMPLVAHVARCLTPQTGQLLLSCNRNQHEYRQIVSTTVADIRSGFQGPLAGIEAASTAINTEFVVIVACDTPKLPGDLVQRLVQPLSSSPSSQEMVCVANDGTRDQYLCAAMHTSCLLSLPDFLQQGQRSVKRWYQTLEQVSVDFSDCPASFANYNSLEAMAQT